MATVQKKGRLPLSYIIQKVGLKLKLIELFLVDMDDEVIELEAIVAWVSLPETLSIIGLSTRGINFSSDTDKLKRIYRQKISEVFQ